MKEKLKVLTAKIQSLMTKKTLIGLLLVIAIGGLLLYSKKSAEVPVELPAAAPEAPAKAEPKK